MFEGTSGKGLYSSLQVKYIDGRRLALASGPCYNPYRSRKGISPVSRELQGSFARFAPEEWSEDQKSAVALELERVLGSPSFRNSRRCQDLLRYTVHQTLAGLGGQIKERTIGVEAFGRPAAYDTAQDPTVRVAAMEVRKRLAQYYQETGTGSPWRIQFPAGAYTPEFYLIDAESHGATTPPGMRRLWITVPAVAVLAVLVCWGAFVLVKRHSPLVLDDFWAPVLENGRPVLISIGQLTACEIAGDLQRKTLAHDPALESPMLLQPGDLHIFPDRSVPYGDALALARFSGLFTSRHKDYQIRLISGTSFADLRDMPTVLIGGYNNEWTTRLTADSRFSFRPRDRIGINDRLHPKNRKWTVEWRADWDVPEDYALVSRVFDPTTGNMIVVAAGTLHYGTFAAAEFLTGERWLSEAIRSAPAGWQKKNVQFVLRTKVLKKTAGPPEVLATHVWEYPTGKTP
jgi:hypothetical protein